MLCCFRLVILLILMGGVRFCGYWGIYCYVVGCGVFVVFYVGGGGFWGWGVD